MAKSPAVQAVFGSTATRKRRRRSGGTCGGAYRRQRSTENADFRRGRSLAGRRLGLQAGTMLRLSPGDGKWRRRYRPASRSSGRRQFAPVVLPCQRIEDGRQRSCSPCGARLQHAAHRKERRGAWLGLRGKAAGVLRGAAGRGRAGHGRGGRRRADAGLRRLVGARLLPGWAWRAWERVSGWVGGEMGRAWWAAA
jgi:hypothetical protein